METSLPPGAAEVRASFGAAIEPVPTPSSAFAAMPSARPARTLEEGETGQQTWRRTSRSHLAENFALAAVRRYEDCRYEKENRSHASDRLDRSSASTSVVSTPTTVETHLVLGVLEPSPVSPSVPVLSFGGGGVVVGHSGLRSAANSQVSDLYPASESNAVPRRHEARRFAGDTSGDDTPRGARGGTSSAPATTPRLPPAFAKARKSPIDPPAGSGAPRNRTQRSRSSLAKLPSDSAGERVAGASSGQSTQDGLQSRRGGSGWYSMTQSLPLTLSIKKLFSRRLRKEDEHGVFEAPEGGATGDEAKAMSEVTSAETASKVSEKSRTDGAYSNTLGRGFTRWRKRPSAHLILRGFYKTRNRKAGDRFASLPPQAGPEGRICAGREAAAARAPETRGANVEATNLRPSEEVEIEEDGRDFSVSSSRQTSFLEPPPHAQTDSNVERCDREETPVLRNVEIEESLGDWTRQSAKAAVAVGLEPEGTFDLSKVGVFPDVLEDEDGEGSRVVSVAQLAEEAGPSATEETRTTVEAKGEKQSRVPMVEVKAESGRGGAEKGDKCPKAKVAEKAMATQEGPRNEKPTGAARKLRPSKRAGRKVEKFSKRTIHRLIMKQFRVTSLDASDLRLVLRYKSVYLDDVKGLLEVDRLPGFSGHVHTAPTDKNSWLNRPRWSARFFVMHHGHWFWFRDERSFRTGGLNACLGSISLLLYPFTIDLHPKYTTRFCVRFGDWYAVQIDTSIEKKDRGEWAVLFLAAGNLGEQIRMCFLGIDWQEVQDRGRLAAKQNCLAP
ncbi:putative transmembrane protein [Toxoplasma gondii p89]|uniref:Putative transmembrane protein n=1 Tax=Toxoplasma gondii p89 TaxID=943119 RepID=A0A086KWT3_TOXGO|nr:putative transmembrane protein [Toxoplasma gondii p89]